MQILHAVLAAALPACAAGPELEQAAPRAREAVEEYEERREAGRRRHQDLERLRQDLRYIAETIDRERVGEKRPLKSISEGCLARVEYLKQHGRLDPRLYDPAEVPPDPDKVLNRVEALCRALPGKAYAEQYPRSLVKAVATELKEAAEGMDADAILALLRDHLVLPEQGPGEEDAFSSLALFPVDVPLDRFKKLGAIRIFLVKHRIKRPKSHARTTWQDILAGRHDVQAGVEIEGVVRAHHSASIDLDYTFDVGDIHIEMTPEWRLLHPEVPKPRKGDRVRLRGWTYFDVFHKAEMEYDPEDPVLGVNRVTQWEIHPVQDVEILP